MASRCEVCGKGTVIGRNIRSNVSALWKLRAPKKSRTFKANVRKATLMFGGQPLSVNICTRCLRTMAKTEA
ncbi:MAG TPA: 50S ribosomal protein L28 [Chloroflexota bacterium]|nr:50S ribosomal protein L28 [Chloroflexota bacterium]